ncbi:MAG: hypothetical protein JXA28_01695 [Bacteroidetes bacterium]|nr:hypothetical protein [Bacteroidota bacterium]
MDSAISVAVHGLVEHLFVIVRDQDDDCNGEILAMHVPRSIQSVHLTALLLASCSASHEIRDDELTKDPSFGFESLRGHGLFVAGISATQRDFPSESRASFGNMISNMLIEDLGGAHAINIIPTSRLVAGLGLDVYDSLLSAADREGMLFPESIRRVEQVIPGIRYILLLHVKNENVFDYRYEQGVIHTDDGHRLATEYEK